MFKITSDVTTLGAKGAVVDDDALVGLNVDALIAGGHVERVNASVKKQDKREQE